MFGLIICSLLFIKTEKYLCKIRFYDNENAGQDMIIENIGSLEGPKSVNLLGKTGNKNEVDFLFVADYKQYVRIVNVEKKIDESDESATSDEVDRSFQQSSHENEDLQCQEFYTIFVDMKGVDINPFKTFSFNFEFDNNECFMTCPFHYSEKEQKWVLGYSEWM